MQNKLKESLEQMITAVGAFLGEIPPSLQKEIDQELKTSDVPEEEAKKEMDELQSMFDETGALTRNLMQLKAKMTFQMYQAYIDAGFTNEAAVKIVAHQNLDMELG
jgi:hypothetical protein